ILEQVAAGAAGAAAQEDQQGKAVRLEARRLPQALDGKRRVGVETAIAPLPRAPRGVEERGRGVELRHQAVEALVAHPSSGPDSSARVSKMEIMGRRRMKTRSRDTKRPIDPRNVAQSQTVPR